MTEFFKFFPITLDALPNTPLYIVQSAMFGFEFVVFKLKPELPFICAECMPAGVLYDCVHCQRVKAEFPGMPDPKHFPTDVETLTKLRDTCMIADQACIDSDAMLMKVLEEQCRRRGLSYAKEATLSEAQEMIYKHIFQDGVGDDETLKTLVTKIQMFLINRFNLRSTFPRLCRYKLTSDALIAGMIKGATEHNARVDKMLEEHHAEVEDMLEKAEEDSNKENIDPHAGLVNETEFVEKLSLQEKEGYRTPDSYFVDVNQ